MQAFIDLVQQFWIDLQQGQLRELGPWNYLLLALLIVWQGPIATLLGGAAASAGFLRPSLVFLAGVTGNLMADILWYSVGRRGNVDKIFDNRHLKIYRGKVDTLKATMEHHAPKFLLMAKLSFGLAVPTLVAAGLTRLRWRKWFPIVFIGETIFTGTLVIIGYFATEAIKRVEHGIQFFFVAISFIFILMVAWFIPRTLRQDTTLSMSHYKEKSN
jgi:membrane protein DedA with SNARE-associated domain